jgi:hypothetical protein
MLSALLHGSLTLLIFAVQPLGQRHVVVYLGLDGTAGQGLVGI